MTNAPQHPVSQDLIDATVRVVKNAGHLTSRLVQQRFKYRDKSKANFVSEIDLQVQMMLRKTLQTILPPAVVVAEELATKSWDGEQLAWVIDPIDGTTNLIHRYPHYSISVALVENAQPLLALVYNPTNRELFRATKGGGAFLNQDAIRVSNNCSLASSVISFGLPYDRSRAHTLIRKAGVVFDRSQDLRRSGSSALDFAYLACGRVDGYFEFDLQPWDHAAGVLLVEEAGGVVSDWRGQNFAPSSQIDIVASNGKIHTELLNALRA